MLPRAALLTDINAIIRRRPHEDLSLQALATRAGRSRFQYQRWFKALAGETPKQFTLRLRLERAAGELLASDKSVLAIALAQGFASHEVFTRAFYRHFGLAPMQYRRRGQRAVAKAARGMQRQLIRSIGPCLRLHHFNVHETPGRKAMPLLSIERKELQPMSFLFIRRQAAGSELAATLGECFGQVFGHCMKNGLKVAGFPLARYPVVGPLLTVEAGVPLASATTAPAGMEYCELPGGPAVFAVHAGAYEQLGDTHAAILRWLQEHKLRAGPHWEWYVTDPGEHPDPADWRTQIYYPLVD